MTCFDSQATTFYFYKKIINNYYILVISLQVELKIKTKIKIQHTSKLYFIILFFLY